MTITNYLTGNDKGNMKDKLRNCARLLRHYHVISYEEYADILNNINGGDFD